MKIIQYILFFIFFYANGQSEALESTILKENETVDFNIIDTVPIFPGCENEIDKKSCFFQKIKQHIIENFKYPDEGIISKLEGKVNTKLIIDKDGLVIIDGISGPSSILKDDAKLIFEKLPKMIAGKHQNKICNTNIIIPIIYKLDDEVVVNQNRSLIKIDFPPVFIGCENAENLKMCFQKKLQNHIIKNFRYPREALKQNIQGTVHVFFNIDKEGFVNVLSVRSPHHSLEIEAKRIISLIPKLIPAKNKNNEAVTISMSVPISFKIDKDPIYYPSYIERKRNF